MRHVLQDAVLVNTIRQLLKKNVLLALLNTLSTPRLKLVSRLIAHLISFTTVQTHVRTVWQHVLPVQVQLTALPVLLDLIFLMVNVLLPAHLDSLQVQLQEDALLVLLIA